MNLSSLFWDCVRTVKHTTGFNFSFLRIYQSWNGERVQIQKVGKEIKISRGQKRVIEERRIRKQEATSLGFVLQWSYTIQQWVQINSLSFHFKLSRNRTSGLFSHSRRIVFCKYFLEWKSRKMRKNPNLPNAVRALLLTNPVCPRGPAGCERCSLQLCLGKFHLLLPQRGH